MKKKPISLLTGCAGLILLAPALVLGATEKQSTLTDQTAVAVTIYNENLALIKDTRRVALDLGVSQLALRDVSGKLRAETAQLRSLTDVSTLSVIEQNFDFDLLTPAKLLEKNVGRTVRVIRMNPATGTETVEEAIVLSAQQGVVLKIGDRIETGLPGRLVFDGVPPHLRDRPTLSLQLDNRHTGKQDLELSYLTGGLSWKADYVAELNAKDNALDLNGWVTLTNRSGTTYPDARLQLVAGDVNIVRNEFDRALPATVGMSAKRAKVEERVAQESLFEYHLYTLPRATTVADNQTKQVALLNAHRVPVKKELVLRGADYYYRSSYGDLGQKMKVGVFVEFDNREKANLGLPLPKGIVRVYKKDSAGRAQFAGEDRIDHTPKNETVRLKLGEAFDVTADKKQTDFKTLGKNTKYHYAYESAYELVLKNVKAEPVTVTVMEPVPGDWQMLEASHKHTKAAAGTALWRITIPAESRQVLRYRVVVRY